MPEVYFELSGESSDPKAALAGSPLREFAELHRIAAKVVEDARVEVRGCLGCSLLRVNATLLLPARVEGIPMFACSRPTSNRPYWTRCRFSRKNSSARWIRCASVRSSLAAVTGSTSASSACSAGHPSAAARASSCARTAGSAAGTVETEPLTSGRSPTRLPIVNRPQAAPCADRPPPAQGGSPPPGAE